MSWLAMAASLSAVGIALVLARRGSETPIEAPAPRPAASSANALPQAPEGPMFPKPSTTVDPSITAQAAARSQSRSGVTVAPEAMREFERQVQGEPGKALAQAVESNEGSLRDRSGVVGGVAGGIVGGLPAEAPAVSAPPVRVGGNIQGAKPQPAASAPSAGAAKEEIAALRKDLEETPTVNPNAAPDEVRREMAASDARREKVARLREPTRVVEEDKLRSLGYAEPPRVDRPLAAPAQPRDMFFESKGTNPFIITEEDPQATFGLDVDTASYTLTRNYLNRGTLPPAAAVRVEEFINAFPNNVAADRGRDSESAFAVRVDGAPNPLHSGYHFIRVAMKAREVDPRERKAAHLTFVIDVSGSMAAENRLGLVKRSLGLLVDKLDERDTIGIVVYGTTGRRVLAPTSAGNRDRIMAVIDRLRPEGSTNLQEGLDLGYEMAMESFTRPEPWSNRLIEGCQAGMTE